jgi:hypothetical protein
MQISLSFLLIKEESFRNFPLITFAGVSGIRSTLIAQLALKRVSFCFVHPSGSRTSDIIICNLVQQALQFRLSELIFFLSADLTFRECKTITIDSFVEFSINFFKL